MLYVLVGSFCVCENNPSQSHDLIYILFKLTVKHLIVQPDKVNCSGNYHSIGYVYAYIFLHLSVLAFS